MSSVRLLPVAALILGVLPALALADDVDVIVGFHGAANPGVFAKHGGTATTDLGAISAHAGKVPPGRLRALRAEAGVAYVEEDGVCEKSIVLNDPFAGGNYQGDDYSFIRLPEAWDASPSIGTGVRVAVLDTGIQLNHEDLAGQVVAQKNWTSTKFPSDVNDKDGHGTHTAGTVGALANNTNPEGAFLGGVGVAFNCRLAIGKVLGPSGGYDSWIAGGITWSWTTAGAKVINMSLGRTGTSTSLENAVNGAWEKGLVVVAAAGNSNVDAKGFIPASFTNCISVAAIDTDSTNNEGASPVPDGSKASFSNYGPSVDVAAPGVRIASTYKGNQYYYLSGTSMASPHVAGVAALVFSAGSPSNDQVRHRIESTRVDTGYDYPDNSPILRVDALGAVSPGSDPELLTAPALLSAVPGSKKVTLTWSGVDGASQYVVKRSLSSAGPFDVYFTATGTSFTNEGLTSGTTYYYVVSARAIAGNWQDSPNSNVMSAKAQ